MLVASSIACTKSVRGWCRLGFSCLAVAVLLVTAIPSGAADLYVNNRLGNDLSSGHTATPDELNGPLKTINHALEIACPADRVILADTNQPYREQISICGPRLHGFKGKPFTILGNGAVLDGTVRAELGAWKPLSGDVFAMTPRRLRFQQLFREGKPLKRANLASGVEVAQALEPLQWVLARNQLLFRVEEGKLPQAYGLRHSGLQTGITLYNTHHVVIQDLIVQGFQQDGINCHELVRDCELRGVECRANGRSGLSTGGVSRVNATLSNFYDNGTVQVRTEGMSRLRLAKCEVSKKSPGRAFEVRGGRLDANGERILAR